MAIGPWESHAAAASGHIRASDADRDRAVDALKAAYVYGLLTTEELAARTGQALAARTYADLAAVTAVLAERRPAPASAVGNLPARKRISRKAMALGTGAVVLPPAPRSRGAARPNAPTGSAAALAICAWRWIASRAR